MNLIPLLRHFLIFLFVYLFPRCLVVSDYGISHYAHFGIIFVFQNKLFMHTHTDDHGSNKKWGHFFYSVAYLDAIGNGSIPQGNQEKYFPRDRIARIFYDGLSLVYSSISSFVIRFPVKNAMRKLVLSELCAPDGNCIVRKCVREI